MLTWKKNCLFLCSPEKKHYISTRFQKIYIWYDWPKIFGIWWSTHPTYVVDAATQAPHLLVLMLIIMQKIMMRMTMMTMLSKIMMMSNIMMLSKIMMMSKIMMQRWWWWWSISPLPASPMFLTWGQPHHNPDKIGWSIIIFQISNQPIAIMLLWSYTSDQKVFQNFNILRPIQTNPKVSPMWN